MYIYIQVCFITVYTYYSPLFIVFLSIYLQTSIEMFNNDVSYLYSDEYLTSSLSNAKELSPKVSNIFAYEPIRNHTCRKTASSIRRRKHILVFNEEILKRDKRRDKHRINIRRLKEKRQSIEENLHKKIKELEGEQSNLETDLAQLRLYKSNLEAKINSSVCANPIREVLVTDNEKMSLVFDQYSDDFGLPNMGITNIFNLNDNFDTDLEY